MISRSHLKLSALLAAALLTSSMPWAPLATAQAQTQAEINQEAKQAFDKADAKLNKVYQKLLALLEGDAKTKLKAAQRAWIAFRDAESQFQAEREAGGGSLAAASYYAKAEELTTNRIDDLQTAIKEAADQ